MSATFENVLYEVRGPLALVQPESLVYNAISLGTLEELHQAVTLAEHDEAVRVLAFTGAGDKAFASGSDLAEVETPGPQEGPRAYRARPRGAHRASAQAHHRGHQWPLLMAVASISPWLRCACCASETTSFATPEGKLGIIPGGGATQRLPRIVGRGWGMHMLLMGEPIDAQQALSIGLVTLPCGAGYSVEVQAMAEHLATFAPFVPRFMKAMVHSGMEAILFIIWLSKFAQGALCETEDKKEGLRAFLEKRPPQWQGRCRWRSAGACAMIKSVLREEKRNGR